MVQTRCRLVGQKRWDFIQKEIDNGVPQREIATFLGLSYGYLRYWRYKHKQYKRTIPLSKHELIYEEKEKPIALKEETEAVDEKRLAYFRSLNFEQFCKYFLHFTPYAHQREWYVVVKENQKVLILSPRGHGKTDQLSIPLVCYTLIQEPDMIVIVAAHSKERASHLGWQVREIMEEELPGYLDREKKSSTRLRITGSKTTSPNANFFGVGGKERGLRGHVVICDDLFDFDMNVAIVEQTRKIWLWYHKKILPMLLPGGKVVVVGTRYNFTDFYTQLMSARTFYVLKQKAIMEYPTVTVPNSGLVTRENIVIEGSSSVLCPELYDCRELIYRRFEMGNKAFNQEYQNEVLDEDTKLKEKWLKFFDQDPGCSRIVQFVDPAFTEGAGDYTAIATIGLYNGCFYLLDLVRGQWAADKKMKKIKEQYDKWSAKYQFKVYLEEVGGAKDFVVLMQRLTNVPVIGVNPTSGRKGSKERRIEMTLGVKCEQGKVYVRRSASMYQTFREEYLSFPNGENDDCIDAVDQGIYQLAGRGTTVKLGWL